MIFKKRIIVAIIIFLGSLMMLPSQAYAAGAAVVFGSDSYERNDSEEFPVGVYVNGDDTIGFYHVEVTYDPARLEYIGGATSGGNGVIIFEGNGNSESASTMLQFRPLSGGDTQLSISEARVTISDTDGETFDITEKATVPVKIAGEDLVAATATGPVETESETPSETGVAEETTTSADATVPAADGNAGSLSDKGIGFWTLVIILPLACALCAVISILAIRNAKRKKRLRREVAKVYYSKKASLSEPGSGTEPGPETETIVRAELKPDTETKIGTETKSEPDAASGLEKQTVTAAEKGKNTNIQEAEKEIVPESDHKEPVIQVKNVSMTFKVSGSNAAGLKEYVIQKAKGKIKYRKLNALDNISFDVYKGEVVGIIGTNGSGKSTLLKIVSGALKPTSGEVIADKKKIQLLTLGTGFDSELSARENVYLNGAIIGYTKEFIDEHYDEIVEFAELQDFMEEKVKNFSSGMVSRLGFSIATVAGAAEILILDEVLSVGDQFFRKKSMERIQKMIHGGSTVLIVSHSLGNIKSHCTKVVWIEKGKLQMVGDPKTVCEAYENQQNVVKANENGELAYYKGDVFQKEFTGVVKNREGNWVIIKQGLLDVSFTGAKWVNKVLRYFKKGVSDNSYTGIAVTESDNKVYFNNGSFQSKYTGPIEIFEGELMYFKKGIFDPEFTGESEGYSFINGIAKTK